MHGVVFRGGIKRHQARTRLHRTGHDSRAGDAHARYVRGGGKRGGGGGGIPRLALERLVSGYVRMQ